MFVENIPFTNIVSQWSEQTAWSGTKTDCAKVGNNVELNTGKLTGTYVTPVRDVGYLAPFKVGVNAVVIDATSSDATWAQEPDGATWAELPDSDRWSGNEIIGGVTFEINTSEDNISWSGWREWQAGDYRCRYFQIRATLTRENTGVVLQLTELNVYADLPDVDEVQDGSVSVAASGCDITFAKEFHESPALNVTILTGSGIYWKATTLTTTGVNIKLYDVSGTAVTGTFRIHIHGI